MGTEFFASMPILIISGVAILALVLDALIKDSTKQIFAFGVLGLCATALAAGLTMNAESTAFGGMVRTGGYASFFDILFCISGVLTMVAARPYLERENFEHDEFYSLIVYAVSGMVLIAHSYNLLVL